MPQPEIHNCVARFMEWFRDSKAVNNDGSPMLLYHGTRTSSRPLKHRPSSREDEDFARIFSEERDPLRVYLSIWNPFRGFIEDLTPQRVRGLQAEGYDRGAGRQSGFDSSIEWVAFFPTRIKIVNQTPRT